MFAGVGLLNQPHRVSNGAADGDAADARGLGYALKETNAASAAQPKSIKRGFTVFIFTNLFTESINYAPILFPLGILNPVARRNLRPARVETQVRLVDPTLR